MLLAWVHSDLSTVTDTPEEALLRTHTTWLLSKHVSVGKQIHFLMSSHCNCEARFYILKNVEESWKLYNRYQCVFQVKCWQIFCTRLNNIFKFLEVRWALSQLCYSSTEPANGQHRNDTWPCSNKTWWPLKFKFHIIFLYQEVLFVSFLSSH